MCFQCVSCVSLCYSYDFPMFVFRFPHALFVLRIVLLCFSNVFLKFSKCFPYVFPMVCLCFFSYPLNFQYVSDVFFICCSYICPMLLLGFCYAFLMCFMRFLYFPHACLMFLLCFSFGLCSSNMCLMFARSFSCVFPMVFLCVSYILPEPFFSFSYAFPVPFLCFPVLPIALLMFS